MVMISSIIANYFSYAGQAPWRQNEVQSVRLGGFNRAEAYWRQNDALSVSYRGIKLVANIPHDEGQ